eukprot:7232316-Alexandrium_andersonii.AAC.1
MSASLVGSEMCIRDSDAAPWVAPGPVDHDWVQATLSLDPQPATRISVSYTHLTLPTICSV